MPHIFAQQGGHVPGKGTGRHAARFKQQYVAPAEPRGGEQPQGNPAAFTRTRAGTEYKPAVLLKGSKQMLPLLIQRTGGKRRQGRHCRVFVH
ncbi:hypothetical protein Defa_10330 [Desulfovibrio sp. TH_2024_36128]|uniref:Uncharacterized protein n=1 Tax=Desulfovibrio falkowii TaxID=3136602 RepID=A0ABQ0E722_9BACT